MADPHRAISAPLNTSGPTGERRKKSAQPLLTVGIVLLLMFLLTFAVYQCARHLTVELNTLRTQEIVDSSFAELELYLFRDEEIITASAGNVFCYDVRNGEKVPVDTPLGQAYTTMDGASVRSLQKQLNAYGDRIAGLARVFGGTSPTDAAAAAEKAESGYRGVLDAAASGSIGDLGERADGLLSALDTWRALTGSGEDRTMDAEALRAAQAELVRGLIPAGGFSTARAGWFYYGSDGYESVFPYDQALTMSPAEFRQMVAAPAAEAGFGTAGHMVYTDEWYAAALMTVEDAAVYRKGTSYRLLCDDGLGTVLTITVERVESDGQGALVVFSSQDMPEGFAFTRRLCGRIAVNRISGYRIPTGALVTQPSPVTGDDVTGVYVLEGNRVEFRRIMISVSREGYVIAHTSSEAAVMLSAMSEAQQQQINDEGWSFLQLNDRIITGGRNLYEGKTIG